MLLKFVFCLAFYFSVGVIFISFRFDFLFFSKLKSVSGSFDFFFYFFFSLRNLIELHFVLVRPFFSPRSEIHLNSFISDLKAKVTKVSWLAAVLESIEKWEKWNEWRGRMSKRERERESKKRERKKWFSFAFHHFGFSLPFFTRFRSFLFCHNLCVSFDLCRNCRLDFFLFRLFLAIRMLINLFVRRIFPSHFYEFWPFHGSESEKRELNKQFVSFV